MLMAAPSAGWCGDERALGGASPTSTAPRSWRHHPQDGAAMSTATLVPETWELSGDDAWRTLRDTGRRRLLGDAFQRMRSADGFSHARSLAFLTSLVLVQGLIAIVGLATALGDTSVARLIISTIHAAVPGPAGEVLTRVVASA